MLNAGFIAAACGKLDNLLQHSSNVESNGLSKAVGTGVSAVKTHNKKTAMKPAYRPEYVYGSCNGYHY
ncbi:hypothetical protein TanjilG_28174 [Lupinus angustifolius]|uniref:Uncharacterized protein n=1 Tax=Lupinus angustifolius TaxID=3871 RepID=A0A4P1RF70_LUPAN|nr:hypothetical protein TanjilG_28174 [Lupinus angustifolius]